MDLVADPAAGDSELIGEAEVAKSGEKPVEDLPLDLGQFNFLLYLNNWCRGRHRSATQKTLRSEFGFGFDGSVKVSVVRGFGDTDSGSESLERENKWLGS